MNYMSMLDMRNHLPPSFNAAAPVWAHKTDVEALESELAQWRNGSAQVNGKLLERIERLEAALRQCLEYIELDSETPHFICDAWDLLKGSSAEAPVRDPVLSDHDVFGVRGLTAKKEKP